MSLFLPVQGFVSRVVDSCEERHKLWHLYGSAVCGYFLYVWTGETLVWKKEYLVKGVCRFSFLWGI